MIVCDTNLQTTQLELLRLSSEGGDSGIIGLMTDVLIEEDDDFDARDVVLEDEVDDELVEERGLVGCLSTGGFAGATNAELAFF